MHLLLDFVLFDSPNLLLLHLVLETIVERERVLGGFSSRGVADGRVVRGIAAPAGRVARIPLGHIGKFE